jgi:hypothetical protein
MMTRAVTRTRILSIPTLIFVVLPIKYYQYMFTLLTNNDKETAVL